MSERWDWGSEEPLPQSDRLQILSPEEYDLLWGLPRFGPAERVLFFTLNQREKSLLGRLRTPRTKAHFLLQLGYFKSRQRFFTLDFDTVSDDLRYICQQYLSDIVVADLFVSKHTGQQHVLWILDLFGFQVIDTNRRADLETRALNAARISSRPLYVLRDLVDYLRRERIVLPGYSFLQDVVRRALSFERSRLSEALDDAMTAEDVAVLDSLLSDDDGLHTITTLKHHPRDFSHQQLLAEIDRGEKIQPLFTVAVRIVQQTELSVESIRFYASLKEPIGVADHCCWKSVSAIS